MVKRSPHKARGFTLIELLVVIAIIAILAAILFPVFAAARNKAKYANCQSNLKQISSAVMMYAAAWNDRFPLVCDPTDYASNNWANWAVLFNNSALPNMGTGPDLYDRNGAFVKAGKLEPYIKNDFVWRDPGDIGGQIDNGGTDYPNFFNAFHSSYCWNTWLVLPNVGGSWTATGVAPRRIGGIAKPADVPMYFDPWPGGGSNGGQGTGTNRLGQWHCVGSKGGYMYSACYVDGHVKGMDFTSFMYYWSNAKSLLGDP